MDLGGMKIRFGLTLRTQTFEKVLCFALQSGLTARQELPQGDTVETQQEQLCLTFAKLFLISNLQ